MKMPSEIIMAKTKLAEIICKLKKLNKASAKSCQKLTFDGYKKWHYCYAEKYEKLAYRVADNVYEQYGSFIEPEVSTPDYDPQGIIYHFTMFLECLENYKMTLGSINKEITTVSGFGSKEAMKALKLVEEQVKTCKRLMTRFKHFSSEATALHDIHMVDDSIYKEYKAKETDE